MNERKSWQRPQLVVLVRGRAEESVLMACKYFNGGGPTDGDSLCALFTCDIVCETFAST